MTQEAKERWMPLGLRYMVESALWFSLMGVMVKWAGKTVPFQQIVFARLLVALILSWWLLRRFAIVPWGHRKGLLITRGLLGLIGLICFFYSITHLPLADATVIQYTNPVFVGIFAAIWLREQLGLRDVGAALACVAGVILIAQPSIIFGTETARLPAFEVFVAAAGALISAVAYVVVRKLNQTEDPFVIVFYFPLVAAPIALPWAIMAGYLPNLWELLLLLGVGITTQLAQVRMTQGLKLESAGRATAMTYLQVVFAFAWGVLLFDEIPNIFAMVGALVVVGTTLLLSRTRRPIQ